MKTLFVSINSKYCHMNPAVRQLSQIACAAGFDASFCEMTVNDLYAENFARLVDAHADVYCFSCYLWNIEQVSLLCTDLKQLRKSVTTVLGGPQVSYSAKELIAQPQFDCVLCGEGEELIEPLLRRVESESRERTPGIVWDEQDDDTFRLTGDLACLPFAYTEQEIASGRLLYYETSRGCPFGCAYCVSATTSGVRAAPLPKVICEVKHLVSSGAKVIKFLDRTFNADRERCRCLFEEFAALETDCVFHFEICADLFDEQTLELLSRVPKGRFQFEIGIQSIHPETLRAVHRANPIERELENIARLKSAGNIHLHLDLIAGLPHEDYRRFGQSFDAVYPLADHFQLGFLKMLPGTPLTREAQRYGYVSSARPPFEVYRNDAIGFEELRRLKDVEFALEKIKCSGFFEHSISYLERFFSSPFSLMERLGDALHERRLTGAIGIRELYELFAAAVSAMLSRRDYGTFLEYLRLDHIRRLPDPPGGLLAEEYDAEFIRAAKAFLSDFERMGELIDDYGPQTRKAAGRKLAIHRFALRPDEPARILLFDKRYDKMMDITDQFDMDS
ncbi:B12-binding domain-containing radical SAM protein [Feifania hominis]|uniref:DUF4080 domain-containing protein n=1 Tax=Feifania hominis TaxID=2763660 RepID=A0A926DCL1_9FIRM|nr:B12-binding domain-containing radical SAM protein [Feifania hominis]MBC8535633.1 DUF4080 domain-containing protein [Feifania hominis]